MKEPRNNVEAILAELVADSYAQADTIAEIDAIAFAIDSNHYLLPILALREVFLADRFTRIPGAQAHFLGLVAIRSSMVPVLDVMRLLGVGFVERKKLLPLLVLDVERGRLGLLADEILGVQSYRADSVEPPLPGGLTGILAGQAQIDGQTFGVLDVAKLLEVLASRASGGSGVRP